MPADTVREAVKAEIRAVTGLDPVLRGDASVSLFPTGRVSFEDVSLSDNRTGKPALTAEHVVARLRFFPLLVGRIEIADVLLRRPTITIVFNADRSSNWSGHVETLARNLQAERRQTTSFSEIRIENGTIILRDEFYKIVETLSNVELSLGVAVDLQELRGHRPLHLAQRDGRRDHQLHRLRWRRCAATARDSRSASPAHR